MILVTEFVYPLNTTLPKLIPSSGAKVTLIITCTVNQAHFKCVSADAFPVLTDETRYLERILSYNIY